ncbi:MAG: PEFG-CTERM sorting domain-containing protein [Thaumarchaeota archaeon]|nr:PEFG-CTERM sorting domain-containing protein [Nitrososphaerota archaeon]MBT3743595.1 PEFG-CTERM sorting domain-containing protein [Nitrososphaerota archaeon]MBT4176628.1 PEFG-CTERM sorting domain-containing protein [Nitrososphaerota archaeon]MBT4509849.1 PEFG-CTERM sorting domain-containing protein [Nitrososphaerota archaeon]MBT4675924.1 PEFG-CTERM sorting domain-containing protein [Nitrososphaerota archaeon]
MQKISLFVILTVILTMPMAFGQEETLGAQKISLTSDNTAYQEGDVITITGQIEKVIPGMPVTLQVFFEKNLLQVSQVKVSQDGKFTDTFTAAGPQWQNEGTVTINAGYGGQDTELNIEFFKNTTGEFTSNYEVKIPAGGTFDVQYTMKGGIISSMDLNQKNLSLEINISTSSDGNLNINLPRDSIDSINNNGQDIDFIVLMYEGNTEIPIQTDFRNIDSEDQFRSINIPVKNGDTKIEIIGTHVVPEFGTIAMIVLAVAIVSIIAVSAKSRLSIMPRI